MVLVPLRKKGIPAVVTKIQDIIGQKMAIRKADFELRAILKIISTEPVLDKKQLALAIWISEYYWSPLGAVIKTMIPDKLLSLRGARATKASLAGRNNPAEIARDRHASLRSARDDKSGQKLILVPEIFLAQQLFRQHTAATTAILHSDLTDKQYFENWLKIKTGEAKTIIGTRIALFAPFANLKEILIENEHSPNYKSQQTPRLHARETALKLAELWNAKITFKSATPSIEASWLAENKKINFQKLKIVNCKLKNNVVDLRQELKNGNFSIFSRQLQEKIKTAVAKKKQILLFINRRGSSTVLMCRDCGHIPKCPNCDVPLVYHLSPIKFLCHHCGHLEIPPSLCPNCQGTRIKFFGTGTQKVEAEFKKLFPEAKTARLDSDVVKDEKTRQQITDDFLSKKYDVLISTQMAFGKDIRRTPLVAIMLADTLLYLPDFRSNERTFQIISQLKNLASENFILQTYSPENQAIKYAIEHDYKKFYREEIEARKELSYPPFSQLIKLEYRHKDAKKTEQETKILTEKLKHQISLITNHQSPITILGPSPAFISKAKGKHIWQIILKCQSQSAYHKLDYLKNRNKILQIIPPGWIVDVDPLQII